MRYMKTSLSDSDFGSDYVSNLNRLEEILLSEQEALKTRDFDRVNHCTTEKETLLNKLAELESHRLDIDNGLSVYNSVLFSKTVKNKITKLLQRCRDLNLTNGSLIEISKQFNRRLLNILLGRQEQELDLYSADGSSSNTSGIQMVTKI